MKRLKVQEKHTLKGSEKEKLKRSMAQRNAPGSAFLWPFSCFLHIWSGGLSGFIYFYFLPLGESNVTLTLVLDSSSFSIKVL